jgi:hypothetical protein
VPNTIVSDPPKTLDKLSASSSSSAASIQISNNENVESRIIHDAKKGVLHETLQAILNEFGDSLYITENIVHALSGHSAEAEDEYDVSSLTTEDIVLAWSEHSADDGNEIELRLLISYASNQKKASPQGNRIAIAPAAISTILRICDIETAALVIVEFWEDAEISKPKLQRIVSDSAQAVEMMELVLTESKASGFSPKWKIRDDESWLLAAVENQHCGVELVSLIMQENANDDFHVSERAIVAAASNESCATELLELLFPHRWHDLQITPALLNTACENKKHTNNIIHALLDMSSGNKILITGAMVEQAAILTDRQQTRGHFIDRIVSDYEDIQFSAFALRALMNLEDTTILEMILAKEVAGKPFEVSEGMVEAAAASTTVGIEIMDLLFKSRADELPITERVLEAVVRNEVFSLEMMELIVRNRPGKVLMTERVFEAAVATRHKHSTSKDIFKLLTENAKDNLTITTKMVDTMWQKGSSRRAGFDLESLLQVGKHNIQVTDKRMKNATSCNSVNLIVISKQRFRLMTILSGKNIRISKKAAHRMFDFADISVTAKLTQLFGNNEEVKEAALVAAMSTYFRNEAMSLVMAMSWENVHITTRVVLTGKEQPAKQDKLQGLLGVFHKRGSTIFLDGGALEVITQHYSFIFVKSLLTMLNDEADITTTVLESIVRNEQTGDELLHYILGRYGRDIRIHEALVQAAICNRSKGGDIISLLLTMRPDEVRCTEELGVYAAQRPYYLWNKLLPHFSVADISQRMVETVASSRDSGESKMLDLIIAYGENLCIYETTLEAAARNGEEGLKVLRVLFSFKRDEFHVTERIMEAAASCADQSPMRMLEFLRSVQPRDVKISERVLEAAAKNTVYGHKIMSFLIKELGGEISIPERVLEAAAENALAGHTIRSFLIRKEGCRIPISERVLEAAARNTLAGNEIITTLIKARGSDIPISERVLEAACSNEGRGDWIIRDISPTMDRALLLRERVLGAAARNSEDGRRIAEIILDQVDSCFDVGSTVIENAVGTGFAVFGVMPVLVRSKFARISITEHIVKLCAREKAGWLLTLVMYSPRINDVELTEKTSELFASTWPDYFVALLEKRWGDVVINERVRDAFVRTMSLKCPRRLMNKVLQKRELRVTARIVQAAVANEEAGELWARVLLEEHGEEFRITKEIMIAAVKNEKCGLRIINLILTDRGQSDNIRVTEELLVAAAQNPKDGDLITDLLLQYCGDIHHVTDTICQAALQNESCGELVLEVYQARTGGLT